MGIRAAWRSKPSPNELEQKGTGSPIGSVISAAVSSALGDDQNRCTRPAFVEEKVCRQGAASVRMADQRLAVNGAWAARVVGVMAAEQSFVVAACMDFSRRRASSY